MPQGALLAWNEKLHAWCLTQNGGMSGNGGERRQRVGGTRSIGQRGNGGEVAVHAGSSPDGFG